MPALKCLDITKVSPREVKSTKTGKVFHLVELQGLMQYEDGTSDVFVLDVFDSEQMPIAGLKTGKWLPTVELMPNRDSRKLEARIVQLRPAVAVAPARAAA